MGIETEKCLIILSVTSMWTLESTDDGIKHAMQHIINRVETQAKDKGLFHPYKYANYCDATQDPFVGYGKRRQWLELVSRKYDPHGVFQRGVPGGHKLWQ